jgi:hypothetical protein
VFFFFAFFAQHDLERTLLEEQHHEDTAGVAAFTPCG